MLTFLTVANMGFIDFSPSLTFPFYSLPVPTAQLIAVVEVLLGKNRYVPLM